MVFYLMVGYIYTGLRAELCLVHHSSLQSTLSMLILQPSGSQLGVTSSDSKAQRGWGWLRAAGTLTTWPIVVVIGKDKGQKLTAGQPEGNSGHRCIYW